MPSLKVRVLPRYEVKPEDYFREGLLDMEDFPEPDSFMKQILGAPAQEFILTQVVISDELWKELEKRAFELEHQLSLGETKDVVIGYFLRTDRVALKGQIRGRPRENDSEPEETREMAHWRESSDSFSFR